MQTHTSDEHNNDVYLDVKEKLLGTRGEPARASKDLKRPSLSKVDKRKLSYLTRRRLERPLSYSTAGPVSTVTAQHLLQSRPLEKSLRARTVVCFLIAGVLLIWPTFVYAFYHIMTLLIIAV